MNDPDTTPAANSHLAPSRQRSRHFGTTRPAARIETGLTPIPSTKLQFQIATICKCIGGRSLSSDIKCGVSRDTFGPLADRPSRASQKISPFLASLPPCILASSTGEEKPARRACSPRRGGANRDNLKFKNRRNQQQTNDIPKVNRDKNTTFGSPFFRLVLARHNLFPTRAAPYPR